MVRALQPNGSLANLGRDGRCVANPLSLYGSQVLWPNIVFDETTSKLTTKPCVTENYRISSNLTCSSLWKLAKLTSTPKWPLLPLPSCHTWHSIIQPLTRLFSSANSAWTRQQNSPFPLYALPKVFRHGSSPKNVQATDAMPDIADLMRILQGMEVHTPKELIQL